ncbi:Cna B-type domain-containing protein [Enterococcus hermanniensis]|uniref:Uncharacterized protein n=1 Tax=Enterococcus hermanniensis TaxID=249189 RepID=A0A1L8TSC8_9ENTE|nr:Cna B-type domain-containing protein [Enterococcus hermanniensis]OJG47062.1 hypothetical protein RV04_GL000309 [Enterococcus hermanniensis]
MNKVDEAGKPILTGATFKLLDAKKSALALRQARTNDAGIATVSAIPKGTYWLYESRSPSGTVSRFGTPATAIQIKVDGSGNLTLGNIADAKSKGVVLKTVDGVNYLEIENIKGETIDLSGQKKWATDDPIAYSGVTIELNRKTDQDLGYTKVDEVYAQASNQFKYQFLNLPKQDLAGNDYHYQVVEKDAIVGWEQVAEAITVADDGNLIANITNYPITGTIKLEKFGQQVTQAENPNFVTTTHLANIEFELYEIGSGMIKKGSYFTDSAGKLAIGDLKAGHYKLVEVASAANQNYIVDGEQEFIVFDSGRIALGNTTVEPEADGYTIPTISMTNQVKAKLQVAKEWVRSTDTVKLPEKLTVTITGATDNLDSPVIEKIVELNAKNEWQASLEDLPYTDSYGNNYVYTAKETFEGSAGYESAMTSKLTIKEGIPSYSFKFTNTLKTVDLEGHKTWDDQDNQYNTRQPIKVQLLQNGKAYGDALDVTAANQADEDANQWQYTFTGLPKADETGKDYIYTVKEVVFSDNYQSEVVTDDAEQATLNLKNTLVVRDLTATKTWEDEDNRYGIRPETLLVTLVSRTDSQDDYQVVLKNGQAVTATLEKDPDNTNQYRYTFKDLPKYDAKGKTIDYAIREAQIAGYEGKNDQKELTNQLLTKKITGTKTWKDNNNFYGMRPEYLELELMVQDANGNFKPFKDVFTNATDAVKTTQEITGNSAASSWSYSFTDLPSVIPTGQAAIYGVKENLHYPAGKEVYLTDSDHVAETEGTLTNSLNEVEIEVQKTWDDQADNFLTRPNSIRFQLYAYADGTNPADAQLFKTNNPNDNGQGQFVMTRPTNDSGTWTLAITGLPERNKNGTLLHYYVREIVNAGDIALPDYTVDDGSLQITNTLSVTDITVNKTWQDDGYSEKRQDVTLQLLQNDQPMTDRQNNSYEVTLKVADDQWSYTFDNLPKKDKQGNLYTYTVKETSSQPDYQAETTGLTATNTYRLTSVEGQKTWQDTENSYQVRPSQIEVQLYQNDEKFVDPDGNEVIQTVSTNPAGTWSYQFDQLPELDPEGKAYNYSVKEIQTDQLKNYTVTEKELAIKNELQFIEKAVRKTWDDQDNQLKTRPTSISVQLKQNGVAYSYPDGKAAIVKLSAENDWQATFTKLVEFDAEGNPYDYTMEEVMTDDLKNYTATVADEAESPTVITNTLTTISKEATKKWDDQANSYDTRPESIKVQLYQDGKAYQDSEGQPVFQELKASDKNTNTWQATFDNLPEYKADGTAFVYTIKEIVTEKDQALYPNYQAVEEGMAVTNRLETIELTGQKTWDDQDNAYKSRPNAIQVQLYQNGKAYTDKDGKEVIEKTTAKQDWNYTFKDLIKYDQAGKEYAYTVKEVVKDSAGQVLLPNYQATEEGMDVTNSLLTIDISGQKTWKDDNDAAEKRPNTITVYLFQNEKKIAETVASRASNWRYTFKDLPEKDASGKRYVYTIDEATVEGYRSQVFGYNLTNTLKASERKNSRLTSGSNTTSGTNRSTGGATSQSSSSKGMLPSTGSQTLDIVIYLGALIVCLSVVMYIYRKKKVN